MQSTMPRALAFATAAVVLLAPAVTACGSGSAPAAASATSTTAATAAAAGLTISDAWIKPADSGMTPVFGTLTATGGPVSIASVTTAVSPRAELHEVVMDGGKMVMRPKKGGFVVDPATPLTLKPGSEHVMVMDLATPVRPGDQVRVTFTLTDGRTVDFAALAKETTSGEESYDDMAGMS